MIKWWCCMSDNLKKKNYTVLAILVALIALLYAVTIVRIKG